MRLVVLVASVSIIGHTSASWAARCDPSAKHVKSENEFVERVSVRRHFLSRMDAPWPDPLRLVGVTQIIARGGGTAWVLEAETGAVWLSESSTDSYSVSAVSVGGRPLVIDPSGRLVSMASASVSASSPPNNADMLVVVERDRIRWLSCLERGADCKLEGAASTPTPSAILTAAVGSDNSVWIGTAQGLWISRVMGQTPTVSNITTSPVVGVTTSETFVAVATATAVFWRDPSSSRNWSFLGVGGVIDPNITSIQFLPSQSVVGGGRPPLSIGTHHALHIVTEVGVVQRFSGLQGLPMAGSRVLATFGGPNASLWIASPDGLVEMTRSDTSDAWRYYSGDRWLVANATSQRSSIVALAVGPPRAENSAAESVVWVATECGLATITLIHTSLETKAAHYQAQVHPRHDRWGWVAQVPLAAYGVAAAAVPTDGDNDGSNTAYYMASQIFRYRVTGNVDAQALSWKSFRAVEFLHNVTRPFSGKPGYIARTAVKCGEAHQGPSGGVCGKGCHCPPAVNTSCPGCSPPPGSCTGCACPGWINSSVCYEGIDPPENCCWSFKSDTSTDETDGHFYGLHIAYDELAESESEKERVARLLCDTTAYIVDGGFNFIDPLTGNRTTWGYWSPEILNAVGVGSSNGVGNEGKPNERAQPPLRHPARMSYGEAMASLLNSGYGENLLNVHLTNPGFDNQGIAWFDFGNAFYTYHSFARAAPWNLSPPPKGVSVEALQTLHQQFLTGFEAYWEARTYNAKDERDGLWSVIYTSVTKKPGLPDPLWAFRRGPYELIDWPTRNSQRLDVVFRKEELACCNARMSVVPLPPDESPDARWEDDSPYPMDGGSGYYEAPPTLYLELYWMARFYGIAS